MKNLKKAVAILGMFCIISAIAGCSKTTVDKDSDSSSYESTSSQKSSVPVESTTESMEAVVLKEMDLNQIKQGDYSSIMGQWEIVAVAANLHDGNGVNWTDPAGDSLVIEEKQIEDGNVILSGSTLNDGQTERMVTFREENGALLADTEEAAVLWNWVFLPKGVATTGIGTLIKPDAVDEGKERIVIRTSNTNYVQVFQREDGFQSSTETQAISEQSDMNLDEVKVGNYTSINGNWLNAKGKTLTVENDTLSFEDLTNTDCAGTVAGQSVDLPSRNAADGSPKTETLFGSEKPSYEKQLTGVDKQSYFTLQGSTLNAGLFISFYPAGVIGDISDSDITQDRIVSLETQATGVPAEIVYYPVK